MLAQFAGSVAGRLVRVASEALDLVGPMVLRALGRTVREGAPLRMLGFGVLQ